MDKYYYLNNSGSRWIIPGKKITFETESGRLVTRKPKYFESFGNFATCNIYWKGKRINVFTDTILED